MKVIAIWLMILFTAEGSFSQSPSWQTLPNAPYSSGWRLDDLSFINENTGWVAYNTNFGGGNTGRVYKTVDGGASWSMQFSAYNVYLRCVGFADSSEGWVGTLGDIGGLSRTPVLYRTTNGGINWDSITFSANRPKGLCGMSVLNRNFAFGCGRVTGPAFFVKTTDGGVNWISQSMSSYAYELVDCKFFTCDSGFVVGSRNSRGLILFTSDGGSNWSEKYLGDRPYDGLWKISFPTRHTGYVSINGNTGGDSLFVIKTTDGGMNWTKIGYPVSNNVTQGIGFLDENTGWAGGLSYPYRTTDGGFTWLQDNFGMNLNRIRFLNDTTGYAVGKTVYKYTSKTVGLNLVSLEVPEKFELGQNYPNPFNPVTVINFSIPNPQYTTLRIYDALGKEIQAPVNEKLNAGSYKVEFDGSSYSSGVYFYELRAGDFIDVKRMIIIK